MRGCGRGFGEPNEILNAQLGPHGQRLQYMTKEHRAGVVERVLDRYTEEHIATLPQMLMDMADRAHFQRLEALQQIHEVVQQLQHIHPEWSVEEVCCVGNGLFFAWYAKSMQKIVLAHEVWHQ